jgi:hypothetical protein
MRMPDVHYIEDLLASEYFEEFVPGHWRPTRAYSKYLSSNIFKRILVRFTLAFNVFIGKYDAVNWECSDDS